MQISFIAEILLVNVYYCLNRFNTHESSVYGNVLLIYLKNKLVLFFLCTCCNFFELLSYFRIVHIMTTCRKLKSIHTDDNTQGNSKKMKPGTSGNLGDECVDKSGDTSQSTRTPRGRTHMDRLSVQRGQGIRKEVEFDSKGRPIGKVASELQSYVGVLAREKVKITYDTWKKVPMDVKEQIWESVNVSPVVYKVCMECYFGKLY